MVSYNHVALAGNFVRDPELRYTPGGTAVCDFSLAVNRKWRDKQSDQMKEEVSFIDCVIWARAAEVISEYMKKGNPILVDGELRQERWKDKQTDQNRSKIKVHIKSFTFLGGKKDGAAGAPPAEEPPPGEDIAF